MKVVGVIPARYGSTRFPGKPLADILGKPMLSWVIEAARSCADLETVIVATDDERICELAEKAGVEFVMTDPSLPSGSDRVWAAVQASKISTETIDVIVNIQGDEPLLNPNHLSQLVKPFTEDKLLEMSTLAHGCQVEDLANPSAAKVVVDKLGNAIYFSRLGIPFSRESCHDALAMRIDASEGGLHEVLRDVLRHIGLYAYRPAFLQAYCSHGACRLEEAEGLEQLRALYLGAKIRVVEVDSAGLGVDTPGDIAKVESILRKRDEEN